MSFRRSISTVSDSVGYAFASLFVASLQKMMSHGSSVVARSHVCRRKCRAAALARIRGGSLHASRTFHAGGAAAAARPRPGAKQGTRGSPHQERRTGWRLRVRSDSRGLCGTCTGTKRVLHVSRGVLVREGREERRRQQSVERARTSTTYGAREGALSRADMIAAFTYWRC